MKVRVRGSEGVCNRGGGGMLLYNGKWGHVWKVASDRGGAEIGGTEIGGTEIEAVLFS